MGPLAWPAVSAARADEGGVPPPRGGGGAIGEQEAEEAGMERVELTLREQRGRRHLP